MRCPRAPGTGEPAGQRGWAGRRRGDSLVNLNPDAEADSDKNWEGGSSKCPPVCSGYRVCYQIGRGHFP